MNSHPCFHRAFLLGKRPWLFIFLLCLPSMMARAQSPSEQTGLVKVAAPQPLKGLMAAAQFRMELAAAVAQGQESPAAAVQRIKAQVGASGITGAPVEVDYASASLGVGHALMAMDRPDLAEVFFRTAEEGFAQVTQRTARFQAKEKAGYLEKLAYVRGRYLNKIEEAKANMAEAIALQPDDASLRESLSVLTRGRGADVQTPSKK